MKYEWTEIRDGQFITPGVDFGAPLVIKHKVGRFVVTHTKGHKRWGSLIAPQIYEPARLRLIRLDDNHVMNILNQAEAGHGKAVLKIFVGLADALAAEETKP